MKYIKKIYLIPLLIFVLFFSFYYFVPSKSSELLLELKRHSSGLKKKNIEVNGLSYSYLEGGTGSPLLLLHGFGGNKDHFTDFAKYLSGNFHIIIPDITGFGGSTHDIRLDFTPQAQAKRMMEFILALGLKKVNIAGNSMGGQIAIAFASAYPQQTQSLFLLAPVGIFSVPNTPYLQSIVDSKGEKLDIKKRDEVINTINVMFHKTPFFPEPIISVMKNDLSENVFLNKKIFNQMMDCEMETMAARIKVPTLIIWGDDDRVINNAGAPVLQNLITGSRLVIMENTGHIPMMEAPGKTAALYLDFYKSL